MAPKLGYRKSRGTILPHLARPLRLMLGYEKTDFEDIHYEAADGDGSAESWSKVKFTVGLDLPNLPYYIDGDVKITQSNAILRFLGRKNKLDGNTEEERIRVDMMENMAMDFRNGYYRICNNPNFENIKHDYKKNIVKVLKSFSDFIGDGNFFAGEQVTFPDFHMYELLHQHMIFDASILEPYPKLLAFVKRFEELPEIAAFLKSEKFSKGP